MRFTVPDRHLVGSSYPAEGSCQEDPPCFVPVLVDRPGMENLVEQAFPESLVACYPVVENPCSAVAKRRLEAGTGRAVRLACLAAGKPCSEAYFGEALKKRLGVTRYG